MTPTKGKLKVRKDGREKVRKKGGEKVAQGGKCKHLLGQRLWLTLDKDKEERCLCHIWCLKRGK